MRSLTLATILTAFALAGGALRAQTGVLDQVSPFASEAAQYGGQGAWFNASASSLTWQCQVKAGMSGQLEGFILEFDGSPGAFTNIRVRIGPGWNSGAAVWTGGYTKTVSGYERAFIDVTSAGIQLNAGDQFVIEIQGNDTGMGVTGSYVPPPGTPLYPEFLYLNGPGCFVDCGWRIGFHTYMRQAGLSLSVSGACGGPMTATVSGGTPSGTAAVIYCIGPGGPVSIPPGYPCTGTMLDLNSTARLAGTLTLDAGGGGSLGPRPVPSSACGVVRVQALDLSTCSTSNVVTLQ